MGVCRVGKKKQRQLERLLGFKVEKVQSNGSLPHSHYWACTFDGRRLAVNKATGEYCTQKEWLAEQARKSAEAWEAKMAPREARANATMRGEEAP